MITRIRRALRRRRKTPVVRTVTLTLTLDDKGFTKAARAAADSINEWSAHQRYAFRLSRERALGRRYVRQLFADWRTELGLDQPRPLLELDGPPRHTNEPCEVEPRYPS